jgi:tetratricopeptide (TPR) repeat protein
MAGAQILCTKCGAASATAAPACAKCGGRNARVCGACGTQNSVSKNFCDKCGQSLAELGPVAPPPAARPPESPASDIPSTAVFRLPTPGEALGQPPAAPFASSGKHLPLPGASLPAAGKAQPPNAPAPPAGAQAPAPRAPASAPAPSGDIWSPAPPPAIAVPSPTVRPAGSGWKSALNGVAALAGISLASFGIWRWQVSQRPDVVVPKLAAEYLEALRTQDYARAYGMFSAQARESCTLDEFRAIRDTTTWTWSDLHIVRTEPGAILLDYSLQAEGAPARTDHVLFTQEGDNWTRPYDWVLMRKVEEAFERGDADRGLLLAQTAATINPRDPMAWGYLCEAAYYRKSPQDAAVRCERALDLAQHYPSSLTLKSLYHLHAILADTYNHALNQPAKALEEFSQMLAFPNISPEDQCQILLARAQAYRQLSRPGEALGDLNRGAELCTSRPDVSFIKNMRDVLRAPAQ